MRTSASEENHRIEVLHEMAHIFAKEQLVEDAIRKLLQILQAKRPDIIEPTLFFAPEYEDLKIEGCRSLDELNSLSDLAQKCVTADTPCWEPMHPVEKTADDNGADDRPIEYVICAPLTADQKALGAICYTLKSPSPLYRDEEVYFAGSLAILIAHAVLLHRRNENIKERQAATEDFEPVKIKTKIRGNSKTIRSVFEQISQVASSDTTVLILGESGVGKELVASAIHNNSPRSNRQMIKINCAAIPESLLESELFGHEKGAFTGATQQKKGRFELANGGTLFLDEIGDISLATQVKLLRFLQEKEFERVGGTETIVSDVRIIAATNRNLEELIDSGDFRLDLFYRLNVFPIRVPALRERKPDIIPIADHFVEHYNKVLDKSIRRITTPAIDLLVSYHWPGNVRELENCIERAVLLSSDDVIHSHHLPPSLQTSDAQIKHQESLRATLDSVERELVLDALKGAKGNMAKAARALGLTERVMGLRTKKYKIDPKKFRL